MANKYYRYLADDLTPYIIQAESDIMDMYNTIVKQFSDLVTNRNVASPSQPSAFDTLEDAQAAGTYMAIDFTGAELKPSSIAVRGIALSLNGFGSAFMPVLNDSIVDNGGAAFGQDLTATIEAGNLSLEGELPFDTGEQLDSGPTMVITGYKGEQKLS